MRTTGLGAALLVSAIFLLVVWVVGKAAGFEVSILGSIGMTVLLTIIAGVVLAAKTRRDRRF